MGVDGTAGGTGGLADLAWLLAYLRDLLDLGGTLRRAWEASHVPLVTTFNRLVITTGDPFDPAPNNKGTAFTSIALIRDYNHLCAVIAGSLLAAILMWGFFRLQWTRSIRPQYTARVMLPRVVVATILMGFSLTFVQAAIDVNNAFCQVVLMSGWDRLNWLDVFDSRQDFYTGPGLALLTTGALLAALFVLAIAYFVRFSVLTVLSITAPLAGVLLILPETQRYAREWMGLFLSTLFMQPLQLLILIVGFRLETSGFSPIRHAFTLASLIVAFKVPGALHSASSLGTRASTAARREVSHVLKAVAKGF